MTFCTNCGTKIEDNVRFCTGCGQPITEEQVERQPAQTETTASQEPVVQPDGESISKPESVTTDELYAEPIPEPEQVTEPVTESFEKAKQEFGAEPVAAVPVPPVTGSMPTTNPYKLQQTQQAFGGQQQPQQMQQPFGGQQQFYGGQQQQQRPVGNGQQFYGGQQNMQQPNAQQMWQPYNAQGNVMNQNGQYMQSQQMGQMQRQVPSSLATRDEVLGTGGHLFTFFVLFMIPYLVINITTLLTGKLVEDYDTYDTINRWALIIAGAYILVMLFVWAFGGSKKRNRINFARGFLIFLLIFIVLFALLLFLEGIIYGLGAGDSFDYMFTTLKSYVGL